jgi:hypothetical protein
MATDKVTTVPPKVEEVDDIKEFITIKLITGQSPSYFTIVPKQENFINFSKVKEALYLKAIDNLMKKNEFLQLMIALLQNQISEEEYEKELLGNKEKYFIELTAIRSPEDYTAIISICKNLKGSITIDEISEIFGIKQGEILTAIE